MLMIKICKCVDVFVIDPLFTIKLQNQWSKIKLFSNLRFEDLSFSIHTGIFNSSSLIQIIIVVHTKCHTLPAYPASQKQNKFNTTYVLSLFIVCLTISCIFQHNLGMVETKAIPILLLKD